jgi:aquaporin Z
MNDTLKKHWPEYLIEAAGLALFMMSACAFGALLEHPASSAHQAIPDDLARRMLMGVAMALTSIGIVYSSWGRRSGAHLNPAMTLTFLRLEESNGAMRSSM